MVPSDLIWVFLMSGWSGINITKLRKALFKVSQIGAANSFYGIFSLYFDLL